MSTLKDLRVLIVEDDSSLLKVLSVALGRKCGAVYEALDGKQALDDLAQHPVDLVLSDIQMPVLDGLELQLNTPLNAIMLNAEILQSLAEDETSRPEEFLSYIKEVESISARMAKIIRGMKDYSRDATAAEFEFATPATWIDDTLRLCNQRFQSAHIRIELVQSDLLSRNLRCQPIQLSQVLMNLLNNSYDAIRDTPEKWVRIEAHIRNDNFELWIEDSGARISDETASKLFQPFFTTKDYGQGTGLGLSISKGLLRRHGGDLSLDRSAANTRFVIQLPMPESHSEAA